MPTTLKHSIDAFTDGDFLDEVSITTAIELSERKSTAGITTKGKAINPTAEFSIKGGGNSGLSLGVGSISITTGLSGGVKYLVKDQYKQVNTDFDDFDASGKHLPSAANVS